MARENFGASQDLSGLFAGYYQQYESQQETLANRASNRALDQQAAADNDMIDQWKSGAIDDKQFLAYAQRRAKDPNNQPDTTAAWKQTVRQVQGTVKSHQVEDAARSIMDGIRNGTRSYGDLLGFYTRQLSGLKRNDPLYEDILGQIDQVKNAIASGRGAGGSGGRRRSGKAAATKFLNAQIDAIQAAQDAIKQASDAFTKGQSVASVTMVDRNGKLVTRDLNVAGPNGAPSADMHSLDLQMLDLFDALSKAHLAKGDHSAAINDQVARGKWITNQIQPRNTVAPEQQANALFASGIDLVKNAANSSDPLGQWAQVQEWANTVHQWQQRLNHYIIDTPNAVSGAARRANPELRTSKTVVEGAASTDLTTSDFAGKAGALNDLATAIETGDPSNLGILLDGVFGTKNDPATDATKTQLTKLLGAALNTVTGQANGTYRMVYTPTEGYSWVPVQNTVVGQNPDGSPLMNAIPLNPATGKPLLDPQKGEQLTQVLADVDGVTRPVLAVSAPVMLLNGQVLTSTAGLNAADKAKVNTVSAVFLTDSTGNAHYWYQLSDGWYRDTVDPSKAQPLPAPFEGNNIRAAQSFATQLGLDPTGTAYFNPATIALSPKGQQATDSEDWYDKAQTAYQRQQAQEARSRAQGVALRGHAVSVFGKQDQNSLASGLGSLMGSLPSNLNSLAQALNIRTLADIGTAPAPSLPPIPTPSTDTQAREGGSPTPDPYVGLDTQAREGGGSGSSSSSGNDTTTITSGQYAGKKVPL